MELVEDGLSPGRSASESSRAVARHRDQPARSRSAWPTARSRIGRQFVCSQPDWRCASDQSSAGEVGYPSPCRPLSRSSSISLDHDGAPPDHSDRGPSKASMLTKDPHGLGKVVPSASRDRERSRRRARSTQAPADAAPDVTSEVGFWTANYAERLRSIPVKCIGIRSRAPHAHSGRRDSRSGKIEFRRKRWRDRRKQAAMSRFIR